MGLPPSLPPMPPPAPAVPAKRRPAGMPWLTLVSAALAALTALSAIVSLFIFLFGLVFLILPFFMLSPPTHAWIVKSDAIIDYAGLVFRCSMGGTVVAMVVGNAARRRGLNATPVIASLCLAVLQLMIVLLPYLSQLSDALSD